MSSPPAKGRRRHGRSPCLLYNGADKRRLSGGGMDFGGGDFGGGGGGDF